MTQGDLPRVVVLLSACCPQNYILRDHAQHHFHPVLGCASACGVPPPHAGRIVAKLEGGPRRRRCGIPPPRAGRIVAKLKGGSRRRRRGSSRITWRRSGGRRWREIDAGLQPRASQAFLEPLPRRQTGCQAQALGATEVTHRGCACLRTASSFARYRRSTSRPSGQKRNRCVFSSTASKSIQSPLAISEACRTNGPSDVQL